jgi:Serine/threonine protein kinase
MSIAPENGFDETPVLGKPDRNDSTNNCGLDQRVGRALNRPSTFAGMDAKPAAGICGICGRPLTQVGPKGECLRCLADLGFLSDSREPEKFESGRRLTPGPLKYDHFTVEVGEDGFPIELGAGAMAITYRARDTVLNSIVALKVIDRKLSKMPGVRSRFLREARAAAQIRHPNIARVTHYGEQDGECFYVMQLVEGETLEAKVRHEGPMPLALALEVMEQATRALAAAEKCGVVHRDIKPSNIMLESDPSGSLIVKVIDYGIAKILDPEMERGAEQTQTGFIGTPAFASPEQFTASEQTKIDARSDIYSLGATFWYCLAGRVPFVGRTLREVSQKQAEKLPLEQLKTARVPTRVIALLQSMLAFDPAKRPQTARELLTAVHSCYLKFSTEGRAQRLKTKLAVASTVLLIAGIAMGAWLYRHLQYTAEIERSIAVLPFENLGPSGEDAYITVGMQDEITNDLARLAGLKVIGSQSTRSYVADKARNLRAIGRDLGVRHLLEGTVSRANDQLSVTLRLVDLRDSSHEWKEVYQRPLKDVFALQNEITHRVAAYLKAPLAPNEQRVIDTPPTSDLQAYELYLRAIAIQKLVRDSAEQRDTYQQRVALLDEAVARDPKFVLAYCELARSHDVLHRTRRGASVEAQTVDHRALAEAALEKARRIAPDGGFVHLALADHFFAANDDAEQARVEIDLARKSLPNNADLESTAGTIARAQGRWDDALRSYERAVTLEPRDNVSRFTLANTYRLVRRYNDFDREMAAVIGFMPTNDSATYRLFRTFGPLEGRGEVTPLRAALSNVGNEDDPDGRVRDLYGIFLALADHDPDTISRILARASAGTFVFNGVKYPKSWYEGLAARMRGNKVAARRAFRDARNEVEKTTVAEPADARSLSLLAMIDAGLEQKDQAIAEAERARDMEPFETSSMDASIVRCNLAVVYAWTGQSEIAISELNSLTGRPAGSNMPAQPTYGDFKLNPLWDPIRNNPRFTEIMYRLAPIASR